MRPIIKQGDTTILAYSEKLGKYVVIDRAKLVEALSVDMASTNPIDRIISRSVLSGILTNGFINYKDL